MKKILILASNPRGDLRIDREIRDLTAVIERSKNAEQFVILTKLAVRSGDLQELFDKNQPNVVHFCGHGAGKQGLVFEDDFSGEKLVSNQAISGLFKIFKEDVECVLLNACNTEFQADAIGEYIPYVIGTSREILDRAAYFFAVGFYRALGNEQSIELCYERGCNAVELEFPHLKLVPESSPTFRKMMVLGEIESSTAVAEPLKIILNKNAGLKSLPKKTKANISLEFVEAIREERNRKDYYNNLRQVLDRFGQTGIEREQPLSKFEYDQRQTFLNKVQDFWIEGFLKPSLYFNTATDKDIDSSSSKILRPLTNLEVIPIDIDESYDELQQTDIMGQMGDGKTLLILGKPGSGKTIALLQLAERLVKLTQQDLRKPIPVVFNLSSWGQKQQPLEEWLIKELKDKYQVPKTQSALWLQQEQLILLLDGLDEVRAERRNACVRAINKFIVKHLQTEIVVCSRVQDYEVLAERLLLSSAICIQPISEHQLKEFLKNADDSLSGLRTIIEQDQEIAEFAKTPLILNMMTWTYQGWSAEECYKQFRISQDRHFNLFESYIEKNLDQKNNTDKYSKNEILHWLSWLAKTMVNESKIIFLIEKMQPTWLQSRSEVISYQIVSFILSFILGIIIVGFFGLLAVNATNLLIKWKQLPPIYQSFTQQTISKNMLNFSVFSGFVFLINSGLTFGISKRELREIKLYEKLKWSFKKARFGILKNVFLGLIFGLAYGLIYGVTIGLQAKYIKNETIIYCLISGGIFVLNNGWISLDIQDRIFPNQGIKNSVKNSNFIGLMQVMFVCIFYGITARFFYQSNVIYNLIYGLFFASIVGFVFWVGYGGSSFIGHFSLRQILYHKGLIPWNYACFLDHASKCRLMKKVGGGYIFYHRMLMEHFAQRNKVIRELVPSTPRETLQSVALANARNKAHSRKISDIAPQPDNPIQNHFICRNCNQKNPLNGKFCIKCGNKLFE